MRSFLKQRVSNAITGCSLGALEITTFALITESYMACFGDDAIGNRKGGLESTIIRAVVDGVLEEIIFRGILQNTLYAVSSMGFNAMKLNNEETKSFIAALIPTSLLFGACHLLNPKPSWAQVAFATCGGLKDGYISHYYGLEKAIWSHAAFNCIGGSGL